MTERISYQDIQPELMKGINNIEHQLKKSGLDLKLLELVKYRVSQINGCAYCLDMHHKELIEMGEEELRLHSLPAWRECPFYSDKERAVLAFAEAVTKADSTEIEDRFFEPLAEFYSKPEIAALTVAVTQINTWNRINKVFRPTPGNYTVGQFE
ncbi:carboxymuconolactone decarboxylase family protein [Aliifodinibius sp. S!AR15-10]|uniref:carboxymuconolactone decarboxylase family protein n=1 Tax=Aliifodinibius sp. S!AR15-10 TaxID=2950437 RepID=UPI002858CD4A|nr:carboxymuconolactone decarboxylase family protein [Aliifodinibius sp. S!AR15-10]MDR8391392.1 carboxymuconolactone decarboxylase family protein [Aliifodinibius sp. S!AR15-10]